MMFDTMEIFTVIPVWIWITISSIFFAFGELLSKKFAINPGWTLFLLFILVDIISASAWIPAIFEKSQLSITGVIWSVVSLIATVLIGVLIFNEKLTLTQTIGLAAGIVSVILLSLRY
jgi:multidrug transporter EmrE-like cation transporter